MADSKRFRLGPVSLVILALSAWRSFPKAKTEPQVNAAAEMPDCLGCPGRACF